MRREMRKTKRNRALAAGFAAALLLLTACRGGGALPGQTTEYVTGGTETPGVLPATELSRYLEEVYDLRADSLTNGISDVLAIGDSANEAAHRLTLTGAVRDEMTAATGTRSEVCPVLRFGAAGASAEWYMDLSQPSPSTPDAPLYLEIREIHEALEQGFAYTVAVDGAEVYYRTYEQIASAPNHYFIRLARSAVKDLRNVRITITATANTSFAISRVWGYADFDALTAAQEIDTKLRINLYGANSVQTASEKLAPYLEKSWSLFDLGVTFRLDYLNLTAEKALEQLTNYVAAAEGWQVGLQIMPAMYWSSSPYATDGLGGNFSDVRYSQILYNSQTGEYLRTTPNVYSSTNWVTTGNDTLNRAATEKLRTVFTAYRKALTARYAEKRTLPQIDYVMEWGVCYKGIGTMTGVPQSGALDGGDFNLELIRKAAADGVTLDPTDGLSYAEKLWLTTWHARYNQMLADTYRAAMENDAVLVGNGTVTLPRRQQMSRLWSHNVQWKNQNPSHDLRISGWMSGIGTGFYSSSEDMYFDDVRYYQYKTAYGRTGCVNLEMAIHAPADILAGYIRQSYEEGLEFVTLFNDQAEYGTADTLKALEAMANEPAAAPAEYRVNLLNLDFCRDAAVKDLLRNTPAILSSRGLTHNTGDGCLTMTAGGTASLTLSVSDGGRAFAEGLSLTLAAKFGKVGDGIRVLVGDSESSLQEVRRFDWGGTGAIDRFNDNHADTFDLSALTKGRTGAVIRIELISASGSVTLESAKVTLNDAKRTGQQNGQTTTVRERRIQNLWISARAVAENELAAYLEKSGGEDAVTALARRLIDCGSVKTAQTLLSGMISQLLPATYVVTGGGRLGCYPVTLTPSRKNLPLTVRLTRYGTDGMTFTLSAERAMDAELTLDGVADGGLWRLVQDGPNTWSILPAQPGADGATAATGGKATFTVPVSAGKEKKTYTAVSGRAFADLTSSELRLSVQDPEISGWSEYVPFTVSSACRFTRRADGSETAVSGEKPKKGDFVILTFDASGETVISCEAVYGKATGTIVSLTPPDPEKGINGSIVLDDGREYELEYGKNTTLLCIGTTNAAARTLHTGEIAELLCVGRTVSIEYCPERYQNALPRLLRVTG